MCGKLNKKNSRDLSHKLHKIFFVGNTKLYEKHNQTREIKWLFQLWTMPYFHHNIRKFLTAMEKNLIKFFLKWIWNENWDFFFFYFYRLIFHRVSFFPTTVHSNLLLQNKICMRIFQLNSPPKKQSSHKSYKTYKYADQWILSFVNSSAFEWNNAQYGW